MDELEEVLQRLGDAEISVINDVIKAAKKGGGRGAT